MLGLPRGRMHPAPFRFLFVLIFSLSPRVTPPRMERQGGARLAAVPCTWTAQQGHIDLPSRELLVSVLRLDMSDKEASLERQKTHIHKKPCRAVPGVTGL